MVTLPSDYEREAALEIGRWKEAVPGRARRALALLNWPADFASRLVSRAPGVDWVVEKTAGALTTRLNNLAVWSVRTEAILAEFRAAGHPVDLSHHVFDLDLAAIDNISAGLDRKYQAIASAEGLGAGIIGAPAIPADLVALVVLNLRAIGEHAAYHGFELDNDSEKIFALNILDLAASPSERIRRATLSRLVHAAREAASRRALQAVSAGALGPAIARLAESTGQSLARSKFSQFVPVAGAAFGAVSNAIFTTDVCVAARALYRERFLAHKYGPEWIRAIG